jgi:hypothetical protein
MRYLSVCSGIEVGQSDATAAELRAVLEYVEAARCDI